MKLPHRFPFELLDRVTGEAAHLSASANAWWLRSESPLTLPWLMEASAQAAARLLAQSDGAETGQRVALAGIDAASLDRPLGAGDRGELRVRLVGRHGGLVRVESELLVGGETIGRGALTLAALPRGKGTATARPVF